MDLNIFSAFIVLSIIYISPCSLRTFTPQDLNVYRIKVADMFRHAYESYLSNAFPFDELKPISCQGVDTWGSFSLTLIDALDTLVVMKNFSEFRRVVHHLVQSADFNLNINVSVFETNIRVVGGLISAHLLSQRAGIDLDPGWPCSGALLSLAENVARRLLPAFKTKTGMPYGTVNLRHGVPPGETPITCTAGVSTFIVEFGTLSRLTGDPVFENVALNALEALWQKRSVIGLVGNHINVQDGKWTAMDSSIGGGVDSYYEYLVKGSILFQEPQLMRMFTEYKKLISKYMKRDDWHFPVNKDSGQPALPLFQSLETFWPGLLSLVGDIEDGLKILYNYHQLWKQYGFIPEFYDLSQNHVKRDGYPLRPEYIESIMYLYRATKDPHLLEIGVDILESIEHSARTPCGYATIKNVAHHSIEDRMESFFLAETTKYLYLLFDPDNFIHNNGSCGEVVMTTGGNCLLETGGYVFNTEAHPIDIAAVYCCSTEHTEHNLLIQKFAKKLDLHSLLKINGNDEFLRVFRQSKRRKNHRAAFQDIRIPHKIMTENNVKIERVTLQSSFFSKRQPRELLDTNNSEDLPQFQLRDNTSVFVEAAKKMLISLKSIANFTSVQLDNSSTGIQDENDRQPLDEDADELFSELDILDTSQSQFSKPPTSNSERDDFEENRSLEEKHMPTFPDSVYNDTVLDSDLMRTDKQVVNTNESEILDSVSMLMFNMPVNLTNIYSGEVEKYHILSCPAQSFLTRFCRMGQMFNIGL